MNLNGNSKSKTILNGQVMTGYDEKKQKIYRSHVQLHKKMTYSWRRPREHQMLRKVGQVVQTILYTIIFILIVIVPLLLVLYIRFTI